MDGWMMDGLVFPSWFNTRRALSTLFYKKTRASSPPGLVSPDGGTTYSSYPYDTTPGCGGHDESDWPQEHAIIRIQIVLSAYVYVYVRVCGVRFDEEACGGVSP
jgi:hypothetical protein